MSDEYVPQLSLEPSADATAFAVESTPIQPAAQAEVPDPLEGELARLSPAERKAVEDFAGKIDIVDTGVVLQYGAAAQKKVADFSDSTLASVRTKDLGEVGTMLSSLVVELKGLNFDEEEKKGLFGFRKKIENKLATLKADYAKAEVNVDKITEALQTHQVVLLKDIANAIAQTVAEMHDLSPEEQKKLAEDAMALLRDAAHSDGKKQ